MKGFQIKFFEVRLGSIGLDCRGRIADESGFGDAQVAPDAGEAEASKAETEEFATGGERMHGRRDKMGELAISQEQTEQTEEVVNE